MTAYTDDDVDDVADWLSTDDWYGNPAKDFRAEFGGWDKDQTRKEPNNDND